MPVSSKTLTDARDTIAANLDRHIESAEICYADYRRLCKFADRLPADNESFAVNIDGEQYDVEARTIERSKARGGDKTTYHLSRS